MLWRTLSNCLPTRVQLIHQHVHIDSSCPRCNREAESIVHCIVGCNFAAACWRFSGLFKDSIRPLSFGDWFQQQFQRWNSREKQMGAMLCWAIWQDSNNKVWNEKSGSVKNVVALARNNLEQGEQWCAPHVDYYKINVDAATFRDKHRFGFGWVLRDAKGYVLQTRSGSWHRCVDQGFAEALGVKEVLSWIKNSNFSNIMVEMDSLVMVQALWSSVIMISPFGSCIEECKGLFSTLTNVNFRFVKRSANHIAHAFVRLSWLYDDRSYSGSSILSNILDVIVQEMF
ncbi:hypothetical protein CsatA_028320 [Cannabis sativa]